MTTIKLSRTACKLTHKKHHQGSALMIALFVILVMALLGSAILNMQRTSSEAIAQEVLGTRALAAARSGMQISLKQLFPPTGGTSCASGNVSYRFRSLQGLNNCSVAIVCNSYATDDKGTATTDDDITYYRLVSTGSCGAGDVANDNTDVVVSSRTIQVEARSL